MPCHYEIHAGLNLAVFTYEGILRASEIVANADKVEADPGYSPAINELADFRGVQRVDIEEKTLANLGGLLTGLYLRADPAKKIAMLVQDAAIRPLAENFVAIVKSGTLLRIETFDDLDAALAFLGLRREDLPGDSPLLMEQSST